MFPKQLHLRWTDRPGTRHGEWNSEEDEALERVLGGCHSERFPIGVDWEKVSKTMNRSAIECVMRHAALLDGDHDPVPIISDTAGNLESSSGDEQVQIEHASLEEQLDSLDLECMSAYNSPAGSSLGEESDIASPTRAVVGRSFISPGSPPPFAAPRALTRGPGGGRASCSTAASGDFSRELQVEVHDEIDALAKGFGFNWELVGEEMKMKASECKHIWMHGRAERTSRDGRSLRSSLEDRSSLEVSTHQITHTTTDRGARVGGSPNFSDGVLIDSPTVGESQHTLKEEGGGFLLDDSLSMAAFLPPSGSSNPLVPSTRVNSLPPQGTCSSTCKEGSTFSFAGEDPFGGSGHAVMGML